MRSSTSISISGWPSGGVDGGAGGWGGWGGGAADSATIWKRTEWLSEKQWMIIWNDLKEYQRSPNDTSDWPLRLHTASWEDQGGGLPNWTRGPPNWIVSSSDILLGGLYIKIKSCYVWPWRLWLWLPQAYISHIHIHIPPHIHFATNTINLPSCRLLCCCSRRENKRVEDGRFAGDQIFIAFVLPDLFAHQQNYGQ